MPVASSIDVKELYPYLYRVEERLIKKLLGPAQMESLAVAYAAYVDAEYDEDELDAWETELLIRVQMAVVNLAVRAWAPFVTGSVSSQGITEANGDQKAARESTIERMLNAALEDGNESIELLMAQLAENPAQYPDWAESAAFDDFYGGYISTATEFNEFVTIGSSRYTFVAIAPQRRDAEKTVDRILFEMGPELKAQRASDTVTTANAALLELVQQAVANIALADAMLMLSFQISDYGVTLMATSTASSNAIRVKSPVGDNRLAQIRTECAQKGAAALTAIRDLIYNNIDDYPTFRDGAHYTPEAPAPEAFKNLETDKLIIF
jgi:hypothetical protein